MTQEEIKSAMLPVLRKKGKRYRKFKKVWASFANTGTIINNDIDPAQAKQ